MSFRVDEIRVKSSDKIHTLSGVAYIPDGEIKGLLHIVHGMTEYIGRYSDIMSYAAERGYLCFGYDNLGHGKTANDDSELGFIAHKDGWKHLVDDTYLFEQHMKELYPDKKLYVFGHSMGSFIVRLSAQKYGDTYSKLIVCGTGGPNPATNMGLGVINTVKAIKGEKHISILVLLLAFGSYNKKVDKSSGTNWLTKDKAMIEKYANDKYCTFLFTVSAMHDLITLNKKCNSKEWFSSIRKDLPIFLISGTEDPVGNYGKGVKKVFAKLKEAGVRDVTLKLYENGRHEILNDTCRQEVKEDIIKFLEK